MVNQTAHLGEGERGNEPLVCDRDDVGPPVGPSPADAHSCSEDSTVGEGSRWYRFRGDYRWEGVPVYPYKDAPADWAQAIRCVLIGGGQEATDFHLRYFELAPGGYTSLEKHDHAHVIVTLRGKGTVIAGDRRFDVTFLDTVYIAPLTPHQLINNGTEPFGFFCIVDAVRDRPRSLSATDIGRLRSNPRLRDALRHPALGVACGSPTDAAGEED